MIADMISNKNLNKTVTKIFFRGRELNVSTIFIIQFYFPEAKYVTLNCTIFYCENFEQTRGSENRI